LLEKDKIPKGVNKQILKLNVCDNRISALRNKELLDESTGKANLQPNICDLNVGEFGIEKNLSNEPGITELMQLYFDKYDDKIGTFTGMSKETEILFRKDLKTFYTAFTGNETMPPEITNFSDVKLRDYNKQPNCQGPDPKFRSRVRISLKDELFTSYAENIRNMIKNAADNQVKLLEVINDLFNYTIDTKTQKRVIRVNPKLTEESLKVAVEKTRKYIMELYVKCETDYETGIKIYDAIVESKNAEFLPRQIEILTDESNKLLQSVRPLQNREPEFIIAKGFKDISSSESKDSNDNLLNSVSEDFTSEPMPLQPIHMPLQQIPMPLQQIPMPLQQIPMPLQQIPMPLEQIPMPLEQIPMPLEQIPIPLAQQQIPLAQQQIAGTQKRTRKNRK
jgi:hypothetical protein